MRSAVLTLLATLAIPIPATAAALPQDIYIWQRHWTPGVPQAMAQTAPLFSGWRVLVAETDPNGRLRRFAVDWNALKTKPVTAVVRIDGTLARLDQKNLLAEIARLPIPKGAALEIDYDCGSASLAAYSEFLKALRQQKPAKLTITALPAWLGAAALSDVLAASDEAVLQVHAVRSPAQGLFDAKLARRWIDRFDHSTNKPFRIALPDYGTRVIRGPGGAVIAMESESPKLIGGAAAEELLAAPQDVAMLLTDLKQNPPRHLSGITWFRLPVKGDLRIWSTGTLAAVIRGEALAPALGIETRKGAVAGAEDVLLVNHGAGDTVLPRTIMLPASCRFADGIGPYRYEPQKNIFARLQNAFIPGHHGMVIGWARCGAGDFHVQP